jgi:hypothetical protein
MTKSQLLILLLIIALIFYYLNEDKTNPNHQKPQAIINQVRPEPPKLTSPKPSKLKLGLNPPHSQLDEPPQQPQEPEPTDDPPVYNCPGPEQFLTNDSSLNETYRQIFLTLLTNFPLTNLTQQAAETLSVSNQPLHEYFQVL